MIRIYQKKYRLIVLIILLLTASMLCSVHNTTTITTVSSKISKLEEIKRKKMDYVDTSYHHMISYGILFGSSDNQIIDGTDIEILLINLKNILTIFSKFIIALVLSVLLLSLRTMSISEADSGLPSIIMHFLQLKDGKKDAPSYQLTF
jgi:hypothetical protein